jgi:hypothetical protein
MKKGAQNSVFFHPIVIGIYPVLYLLAININQVQPLSALRAGLICLAGCLLLYGLIWLFLRNWDRTALFSSLVLILFYSYGHIYKLIEGKSWLGFVYGKHRFLIVLWLVLFLAGAWSILKKIKPRNPLNQVLNLASVVLIVLPLLQLALFGYQFLQETLRSQVASRASISALSLSGESSAQDQNTPDIYYIILDGYSRADILEKLYSLDTTPFINEMKSLGFVFPDCTQSNYAVTPFSMFASLNMDYLENHPDVFSGGPGDDQVNTTTIYMPIRDGQVRQFLEQRGYKTIAFETDYWWLNLTDADLYIVGNDNPLVKYNKNYEVSSFEEMFIRTTALRIFTETSSHFSAQFKKQIRTPTERRYEVTRYNLEQIEKIPEIPGKKFVYLHLAAPHAPFVFDANGNFVDFDNRAGDNPAYPNEIVYLNKRVAQLAKDLIAKSKTPPIIVIQGDHGWDPRYRLQILNAYYLPNGGDDLLYPEITPVNTFRLIFDYYFGGQFKFLKDNSYFSIGEEFPQYKIKARPYQLTPVPGSCMGK